MEQKAIINYTNKKTLFSMIVTSVLAISAYGQETTKLHNTNQEIGQHLSGDWEGEATDKVLLRKCVEEWALAVRAKNIDGVMSLYASNIISFDVGPDFRYGKIENKRREWQKFFAIYTGSVAYEVNELNVTTNGELAFVHSINQVKGELANGRITNHWVRWTACFRQIDNVWKIVHDHGSFPIDFERMVPVLNLKP